MPKQFAMFLQNGDFGWNIILNLVLTIPLNLGDTILTLKYWMETPWHCYSAV